MCLFLYAKDTQLMWYSCVLASIWAQTLMDSIRLERLLFFFMSINVGYIFILPPNSSHSGRSLFGYLHPSLITQLILWFLKKLCYSKFTWKWELTLKSSSYAKNFRWFNPIPTKAMKPFFPVVMSLMSIPKNYEKQKI